MAVVCDTSLHLDLACHDILAVGGLPFPLTPQERGPRLVLGSFCIDHTVFVVWPVVKRDFATGHFCAPHIAHPPNNRVFDRARGDTKIN